MLIETVDVTSWRPVVPHAKKGWKPPKPQRVPRPLAKDQRPKKRNATSEDLARIFGAAGRYVPGGDN